MADIDARLRARIGEIRHLAQRDGISADEERDMRLMTVAQNAEALADALLAAHDVGMTTKQIDAIAGALGIEIEDA